MSASLTAKILPNYPFNWFSETLTQAIKKEISQGQLSIAVSKMACEELRISFKQWMLLLLPVAASFSRTPVSDFSVGAVAAGATDSAGFSRLYFGTNYEFLDLPLNYSLHAEQAALSNAWLKGEEHIHSLAITAAPCGHCRQFLNELANGRALQLIFPDYQLEDLIGQQFSASMIGIKETQLSKLLPDAFGPSDLGNSTFLMDPIEKNLSAEKATLLVDDKSLTRVAKEAMLSYAPYSDNLAACGIELQSGELFLGRYAENAAYNPCLYPLPAALSQLNFYQPGCLANIKRILFVEKPSKVSQMSHAQQIIQSLKLAIKLDYFSLDDWHKGISN